MVSERFLEQSEQKEQHERVRQQDPERGPCLHGRGFHVPGVTVDVRPETEQQGDNAERKVISHRPSIPDGVGKKQTCNRESDRLGWVPDIGRG